MPSRIQRHQRIVELIAARAVRSQQDLRDLLAAEGIDVTQATLSRDLRALDVAKGPAGYRLGDGPPAQSNGDRELARALERELLTVESGGNLLVMRTLPGHADPLAIRIDNAGLPGCLGTIAGDDTIFVATRGAAESRRLLDRFRAMAGHSSAPSRRPAPRGAGFRHASN